MRGFRQARGHKPVADRLEHGAVPAAAVRDERGDRLAPLRMLRLRLERTAVLLAARPEHLDDLLGRLVRVERIGDLDAGAVLEHRVLALVGRVQLVVHELLHHPVLGGLPEVLRDGKRMRPHALPERKVHGRLALARLQQPLQLVEERLPQGVSAQRARLAAVRRAAVGGHGKRREALALVRLALQHVAHRAGQRWVLEQPAVVLHKQREQLEQQDPVLGAPPLLDARLVRLAVPHGAKGRLAPQVAHAARRLADLLVKEVEHGGLLLLPGRGRGAPRPLEERPGEAQQVKRRDCAWPDVRVQRVDAYRGLAPWRIVPVCVPSAVRARQVHDKLAADTERGHRDLGPAPLLHRVGWAPCGARGGRRARHASSLRGARAAGGAASRGRGRRLGLGLRRRGPLRRRCRRRSRRGRRGRLLGSCRLAARTMRRLLGARRLRCRWLRLRRLHRRCRARRWRVPVCRRRSLLAGERCAWRRRLG